MTIRTPGGVFAAALTPLKPDGSLDLDSMLPYLDFLAARGCHGALLFGTTGEGPSFSLSQRVAVGRVAVRIREARPDFLLLMGTGTPSLAETIDITRAAFEIGMDGVIVLPPYFNRKAGDEGLFQWFGQVIHSAVPADGCLLGYHIPQMSGVHLSIDLLDRLKNAFPRQFVGLKNSWTEEAYASALSERFGLDLTVMTGFDNLILKSLQMGASGCITASATINSPIQRRLWDQFAAGQDAVAVQSEVDHIRAVMDSFTPAPALLKGLLARWHGFPRWAVCPPMTPLSNEAIGQAAVQLGGPF